MRTVEVEVVDKHGETKKAALVQCEDCKTTLFGVFHVEQNDPAHWHMQCAGCGLSYCQKGDDCDSPTSIVDLNPLIVHDEFEGEHGMH